MIRLLPATFQAKIEQNVDAEWCALGWSKFSFLLACHSIYINLHFAVKGADLPYACKGVVCSACVAVLEEGDVDMDVNYALEPNEIEKGTVTNLQSGSDSAPKIPTRRCWVLSKRQTRHRLDPSLIPGRLSPRTSPRIIA